MEQRQMKGETPVSEAITTGTGSITGRLQQIEFEIQYHIKRAAGHLLDVGRCLNAVKDERLVAHGEWQQWVEQNTGMSVRNAQRVMLAAREVPKESTLSHLEFSKVQALLALPSGAREDFAAEFGAEDKSVRELQEAIKAKLEAEKAAECYKQARQKSEARAADAEKKRMEVEGNLRSHIAQEAKERKRLLDEIQALKSSGSAVGGGISAEAQAQIDRLQAELEQQEAEISRQATLRADAQEELLEMQTRAARGQEEHEGFTVGGLAAAVRSFVGVVGVLPHMGAELDAMDEKNRQEIRRYIDMVSAWVESARQAMDTITAEHIDMR